MSPELCVLVLFSGIQVQQCPQHSPGAAVLDSRAAFPGSQDLPRVLPLGRSHSQASPQKLSWFLLGATELFCTMH